MIEMIRTYLYTRHNNHLISAVQLRLNIRYFFEDIYNIIVTHEAIELCILVLKKCRVISKKSYGFVINEETD